MKKNDLFIPSKDHIFHCAIFQYNKGSTAVKVTEKICDIYGKDIITERTCQRWFSKFRSGDFDFPKSKVLKRKKKYEMNCIIEVLKENPFITVREISIIVDIPKSTIYRYLQELGKVNKLGSYVPHDLTAIQKKLRTDTSKKLLIDFETEFFLDQIIQEMKNGSYMIMLFVKDNGLIKKKSQFPFQNLKILGKKLCSVFGGI